MQQRAQLLPCLAASLAALLACALGCGRSSPEITQAELVQRIESGSAPLILDVRTPEEFASGHVPGAMNVPHTELAQRLGGLGLDADAEVVVYCERGGRARAAESILEEHGFRAVRHLDGDMKGWRSARLPCTGC